MAESNGTKTRIIMFLVGVLQIIILGWSGWIGSGVVDAKTHIAALEANYSNIMGELGEIKDILHKSHK